MLFALDLFDYKTQYYQTSCVQSKPAHKNTCRDVDQQFPEEPIMGERQPIKGPIRSMKCGNRVTGNLTLSLVDEGVANDRVVGDIWVPCDPAWIPSSCSLLIWPTTHRIPPNLSLPSISSTCACCTLTTPWISWLHSLLRCILFLADPWHEGYYTTTLANQINWINMFLHVTFSQVLDTTACLRQSECCLMHLAERHMHQLGCWVKRYSWDDEMTCQIWGILSWMYLHNYLGTPFMWHMVLKPFRLKTFCAEKGMAPHAPNAVPGQWSHFQEPALDQAQCARASRDQAPTESQEFVFSLLDLFCSVNSESGILSESFPAKSSPFRNTALPGLGSPCSAAFPPLPGGLLA